MARLILDGQIASTTSTGEAPADTPPSPMERPGPEWKLHVCKRCGWVGFVRGQRRCLPCWAVNTARWRARPENHDKVREQVKRHRQRKGAAWRTDISRRSRRRHPEWAAIAHRKRMDWIQAGDVTEPQLRDIYAREGGRCVYCHAPVRPRFKPHDPRGFDHVISRANGGEHTASNLVVSCRSCNERRGNRDHSLAPRRHPTPEALHA